MTQEDSRSDSNSSDPASHIKGGSKKSKYIRFLAGAGAGNYQQVNQTKNNIINRVTFTQCGLTTVPRDQSNNTVHCEVCYKANIYRPKEVEVGRFDDDTCTNTCFIVKVFRVIKTNSYEYIVSVLSNSLGSLKLHILYAVTVVTTGEY